MFNTEVANFSVVEVDGNLDVKMAAGEGTLNVAENQVGVIDKNNTVTSTATFTQGTTAERPETPANGTLYFDDDEEKMIVYNTAAEPSPAWEDANLTVGAYYKKGDDWFKATSATMVAPVSSVNPVVLTHGSVSHTGSNEGKAWVIDGDSNPSDPTFVLKGLAAGNNWMQKGDVAIEETSGEPAPNTVVDIYNAVSWTMKFTFNFAGDSAPIAVYLDLGASEFIDVDNPSPYYIKDAAGEHTEQTKKGFRVGFYGDGHDVVWGNNTPVNLEDADFKSQYKGEYAAGTYESGNVVIQGKKVYVCNTGVTVTGNDWEAKKGNFELISNATFIAAAHASQTYAKGDVVVHDGKVYVCKADIGEAHAFVPGEWDETDATQLKYVTAATGADKTTAYKRSDYVVHDGSYAKHENLAENKTFVEGTSAAERICVLTPTAPSVTIKCAAWYEGCDPNVISGASMDCLKAKMSFYSRTVNNV